VSDVASVPASTAPDPFEDVPARSSVDYLLRNVYEQLTQLSAQADLKASIVLTLTLVVLSLAFSRGEDPSASLWVLAAFLLVALIAAVLSVLPKSRGRPPDRIDPLFFAHFGQIERERYVELMAQVMSTDTVLYRTLVENIHGQGAYLLRHKYRYLRYAYASLLSGACVAGLVELGVRVV